MGIGGNPEGSNAHKQSVITTALLILVMLRHRAPQPMSTYELGLWILDNKTPPRPLSVIMKTLADDGYIVRVASAGKRAALWSITERGKASLQQRLAASEEAETWLKANPNYTPQEISVLISLLEHGPQSISHIGQTCSLLVSPVRTAVKRLSLRRLIKRTRDILASYMLTPAGEDAAKVLLDQTEEQEAA